MRIYTNANHIEKRAKLGRRTSMAGLAILAIGMGASFAPGVITGWIEQGNPMADNALVQWLAGGGWLFVSMFCLLGGFLLGQIGNANMRRFQQSPRPDEVVGKALKGFDDRNHLYAWATPVDLVFAGPAGIYTIVTRGQGGQITIQDGKMKQAFNWRRFLFAFGQEPTGLPVEEAQRDADKLSAWLNQASEPSDSIPTINPLVVFTNDTAQLDVQGNSAPIVHHKQLKQYLRGELRSSDINRTVIAWAIKTLDSEAERRENETVEYRLRVKNFLVNIKNIVINIVHNIARRILRTDRTLK